MRQECGLHIYFCAFEPKEKVPDGAPNEKGLEPCWPVEVAPNGEVADALFAGCAPKPNADPEGAAEVVVVLLPVVAPKPKVEAGLFSVVLVVVEAPDGVLEPPKPKENAVLFPDVAFPAVLVAPNAGVDDAPNVGAVVGFAETPNADVATGVVVDPNVGVDEDVPKENDGFAASVSVFPAAFCPFPPNDDGAEDEEDEVLPPKENADFGASAGFMVAVDAATPNGDGALIADVVPNPEAAAGVAPNGDEVIADAPKCEEVAADAPPNDDGVAVEVLPNKPGLGVSAGLLEPFVVLPKGDGAVAAGVVDVAVVDAPPKGFDTEADGLLYEAPVSLFPMFPKGLGVLEAAVCEVPVFTPKLNLGAVVVAVAPAGAVGADVEAVLDGCDVTPKLNFGVLEAGALAVVLAASVEGVLLAADSVLVKENVGAATDWEGGGPIPIRDSNDAPGVEAFACSVFVASIAAPKGAVELDGPVC